MTSGFLAISAVALGDSRFATAVVSFSGLGSGIYGNPNAVVGKPSTWIKDVVNGGPQQRIAVSFGYSTWNVDPSGSPVVTTVQSGGQITVSFDPPIVDHPLNWYGKDFIVYGNPLLGLGGEPVKWDTDLANVFVVPDGDFIEPGSVSVSPDGLSWYTYPASAYQGADAYWPTQAFRWNRAARAFGSESDWGKPMPPTLMRSDLDGRSLADVSDLLDGSAGGCAFDLASSGFKWIRYVRVNGNGCEVDGFSRVSKRLQSIPRKLQ